MAREISENFSAAEKRAAKLYFALTFCAEPEANSLRLFLLSEASLLQSIGSIQSAALAEIPSVVMARRVSVEAFAGMSAVII